MIKTTGMNHIHLIVRDLDKSLAFYQGVFGMTEQFRDGTNMVFLNTPGCQDLITLYQNPADVAIAGSNGGVSHFGFRLADDVSVDEASMQNWVTARLNQH